MAKSQWTKAEPKGLPANRDCMFSSRGSGPESEVEIKFWLAWSSITFEDLPRISGLTGKSSRN